MPEKNAAARAEIFDFSASLRALLHKKATRNACGRVRAARTRAFFAGKIPSRGVEGAF